MKLFGITAFLYLLQPMARLLGRLGNSRYLRRRRKTSGIVLPWPRTLAIWSERWRAPSEWLRFIEAALLEEGALVFRGGAYDRYDLELRGGLLGAVRMRMAIEEHGMGKQLARFRIWTRGSPAGVVLIVLCAALSGGAALDQAWAVSAILGVVAVTLLLRMFWKCAAATATLVNAVEACGDPIENGSGSRTI